MNNIEQYLQNLPADRVETFKKLLDTVRKHLPDGFQEMMQYGMVGFVVPHHIFPNGYHVNPQEPLPFIHLASQKNHFAIYHMGLYANPNLLMWFQNEYPKHSKTKLDMGKSCIRFKNPHNIPWQLISELCEKMTPQEWVNTYLHQLK